MKQRILVLGASGFIGRKLLDRLHATDGISVVAGVRSPAREPIDGVDYRVIDATEEATVKPAMGDVDAVVNCAAGTAEDMIVGARILFETASRAEQRPVIVHLSSMAVYGDAVGLVGETTPLKGNLGEYSAAKVAAEQIAASYPHAFVLRPGCVYGPGSAQWSSRFGEWLISRRLGDLGAQGDGYCNLVHVDDVVETIVRCVQQRPTRTTAFNLSTPEPPTWNDYLVCYGRALRAVPVGRVSRRRLMIEGKILAPPLKIAELALRKLKLSASSVPSPMPPSLLRLMRQEIKLDVRLVEQQLGLRWKPLDEGIRETADWYLQTARLD